MIQNTWTSNFFTPKSAGKTVIISNQPYFYKKAELFPGSAFVIGADTAARLINVRDFILLSMRSASIIFELFMLLLSLLFLKIRAWKMNSISSDKSHILLSSRNTMMGIIRRWWRFSMDAKAQDVLSLWVVGMWTGFLRYNTRKYLQRSLLSFSFFGSSEM